MSRGLLRGELDSLAVNKKASLIGWLSCVRILIGVGWCLVPNSCMTLLCGGYGFFVGGDGFWAQQPYDIPLRGLPVTLLCVGKED